MKLLLLIATLAAVPCAAQAQKLPENQTPKSYRVGTEKVFLYRTAADTAKQTANLSLAPGEEITVVGSYSPQWLVVKRTGFTYLAAKNQLLDPNVRPASTVPRTEEYCMILATQKFLSTKVTISIDFGQERKYWGDNRYKNDEGFVQNFNSVIDVLNYMNGQGWEFVNAYVITVANQNVYHYVMKHKLTP